MGTLAASSDNETTAVEAGSQALWGNEGGDLDGLLVTSRSSRAPPGEGEDAFISLKTCVESDDRLVLSGEIHARWSMII